MKSPALIWILSAFGALIFGTLVAFGSSRASVIFIALLATGMFGGVAWAMSRDADRSWLFIWVLLGFGAKLVGTYGRYYMVTVLYGGGDSYRYYQAGVELADVWRSGVVPPLTGQGAFGTQMVEAFTGGMFAIFTPTRLGGFLLFSIFAYFGQILLYAAFRRWAEPHQLKPYAFLVLFLPTYFFWPSSIGKDALVVFAIGGAAYFTSRILYSFEVRFLGGLAVFLGILGLIRIHVAGLVVFGLVMAGLLAKLPKGVPAIAQFRRLMFVGAGVAAAVLVLTLFPDIFGVDLTGDDALEAFTSDVVRRTSERGTVAEGGAVTSPTQIPGAVALVLFRPSIVEASEIQHYFAALETTLVAGLFLWKLPAMMRNWRKWRANGYLVFSTFYVLGFAVAFSVVRNLGIIARQRGQVLAFFLALVVGLGWEDKARRQTTVSPLAPPREAGAERELPIGAR